MESDGLTSLTERLTVSTRSDYAYAFLPENKVLGVDKSIFNNFSLRSDAFLFQAVPITVPPIVPRGWAICKSKPTKNGNGIPTSCVVTLISNENGDLYRVVIARRRSGDSNPFVTEAYADRQVSERDMSSSTPAWRFGTTAGLKADRACLRVWPRALFDQLASDKRLLFAKDWFELKSDRKEIRVRGETKERISPMDSTLWETLGVDITIEPLEERTIRLDVSLYGYVSKDRSVSRKAPDSLYQYYYEGISDVVKRSHAAVCP